MSILSEDFTERRIETLYRALRNEQHLRRENEQRIRMECEKRVLAAEDNARRFHALLIAERIRKIVPRDQR